MADATVPTLLADAVMVLHVAFIAFVVGGLAAVVVGGLRGWKWVRRFWLRATHLGAIVFVVAESWLAMPCPLTTLEAWLRPHADAPAYSQGFIEHWVRRLFAYEVPPWAYSATDAGMLLLTLLAWWYFPPRPRRERPLAP